MKIAVIGAGFVGLAAGDGLRIHGHNVSYVDIDTQRIGSLKKEGLDACFIDAGCADNRDLIFVSVLTPMIDKRLDLRFVKAAIASVGTALERCTNRPIVVVRSTILPGTTERVFLPILEKFSGKKVGKGFGLVMNPEFLREATAHDDFMKPRVVVVGSNDSRDYDVLEDLYKPFGAPIYRMTIMEAELLKLYNNIVNAAKISTFNELRLGAKALGINADDKIFSVIAQSAEAMWNAHYGTKNLGPFRGTCLPKDSEGFRNWIFEAHGIRMPILSSIIQVNEYLEERDHGGFQ